MHQLSIAEIINECQRVDELGHGTCVVNALTERHDISALDLDNTDVETPVIEPAVESAHNTTKALVKFHSRDEFTQIDLIFPNADDYDLNAVWNVLNDYDTLTAKEEADEDINEMAVFTLTLAPTAYKGEYFVTATAPVLWCLQPVAPGSDQELRVLTFLFPEEHVSVFQNLDAETEYQTIEAELDEELRKQAEYEAYIAEQRAKRAEYENQQITSIEQERRHAHPIDDDGE